MILEEIAQFIDGVSGVSYTPLVPATNNVFFQHMPATPNDVVCLFSSPGLTPDPKHGYDQIGVQIRIRGTSILDAYAVGVAIYNLLHGIDNTTLAGGTYVINGYALQSAPINIGFDSQNRQEYTHNFIFELRNISTNRE